MATYGHWEQPIRPKAQISRVKLLSSKPKPTLSGKDLEILEAVERLLCSSQKTTVNIASVMMCAERYEPPLDTTTPQEINDLRLELSRLVSRGGSIATSTALHRACENNAIKVVQLLLEMESTSVDRTPLMIAAKNAAGRCSINGIDDTKVIDCLLTASADKSLIDTSGMTAYGFFRKTSKQMFDITHYHCRGKLVALESKLCPMEGPTDVDLADGKGGDTGSVDYGPEDDEADREMGRGRYASFDDGDY